jgi:putative transferase (TIGR04331 family)
MAAVNRKEIIKLEENFATHTFSINGWTTPTDKAFRQKWLKYHLKALIYSKKLIQFLNAVKNSDQISLGARGKIISRIENYTYIEEHYPIFIFQRNDSSRNKLNRIAAKIDNLFIRNVLLQLPKVAVEYFGSMYDKIVLYAPQSKKFHFEHIHSPFTRLLLAKYQQNGAELIEYQGGGFAGLLSHNPGPVMYEVVDKYITYGWKIHEKDIPGKPYRLIEFKEAYDFYQSQKREKYYDLTICFSLIGESTIENYKWAFNTISEQLDREKYLKVLLRPRPKGKGLTADQEIKEVFNPDAFFDIDKGVKPMAEVCSNSSVIVQLSHPSTNFVECLFSRIPVLVFNTSKNDSKLAKQINPILEDHQILFNYPQDIAASLNSISIEDRISMMENPTIEVENIVELLTSSGKYSET